MNTIIYNNVINACKKGLCESLNINDITADEAREDYKTLEWTDNNTKKQLAEKYQIDSKKSKEIQHAILLYLRDLRNKKIEFNSQDELDFNRLSELPSRYDKAVIFYKEENIEFLKYLLENYKKSAEDIIHKKGNYGLSSADKYRLDRYKNLLKYLEEANPNSQLNHKNNNVNIIIEKLNKQLVDFKKYYLDNIKRDASNFYKNIPNLIENTQDKLLEIQNKIDNYKNEYKEIHGSNFMLYDTKYNELNKNYQKIKDLLNNYKTILKLYNTIDLYVNNEVNDGEKHFIDIIKVLAERINEKQLNIENLEISNINYDPKLFEMFITDGNKKLYARSIWAAENSLYMTAHFRFIITNA